MKLRLYSPNFQRLEELEINLRHINTCLASRFLVRPRWIINLLQSLNTKLVSLKDIIFNYNEYYPYFSIYCNENCNFDADDFHRITNYEDQLVGYHGKAMVKFNHTIYCEMVPSFGLTVNDYVRELRKNLRDFKYSPIIEGSKTDHKFKKSRSPTDNLEINIEIQILIQV